MKIAIPIWERKVSPVFDTASRLMVLQIDEKKEKSRFETYLDEQELSRRCIRISGLGIDVLICGAISRPFQKMLLASGVAIVPWISGEVEEVLQAYLRGNLFHSKYLMPGCNKEEGDMEKITLAIPVSGGKLCSHFGHCEQFALIETENGMITAKSMQVPPPHEPGVLPDWLHRQGADVVIAGGMGARAQELFHQKGIKVITGAPQDSPESLVHQYLHNTLATGENVCDH
jgi:predicted Fe-Mo cluster-binding NifX family protein